MSHQTSSSSSSESLPKSTDQTMLPLQTPSSSRTEAVDVQKSNFSLQRMHIQEGGGGGGATDVRAVTSVDAHQPVPVHHPPPLPLPPPPPPNTDHSSSQLQPLPQPFEHEAQQTSSPSSEMPQAEAEPDLPLVRYNKTRPTSSGYKNILSQVPKLRTVKIRVGFDTLPPVTFSLHPSPNSSLGNFSSEVLRALSHVSSLASPTSTRKKRHAPFSSQTPPVARLSSPEHTVQEVSSDDNPESWFIENWNKLIEYGDNKGKTHGDVIIHNAMNYYKKKCQEYNIECSDENLNYIMTNI